MERKEPKVSLLSSLIEPVSNLLDKAIPDQDLKRKLSHEIATMSEKHAQELALAQIKVNAAEAASGSLFKGGWRPCVGWLCAIAFGYHFVLQPVIPSFDMGTLLTVLGGLLGIGGLRTYEKQKGLTK